MSLKENHLKKLSEVTNCQPPVQGRHNSRAEWEAGEATQSGKEHGGEWGLGATVGVAMNAVSLCLNEWSVGRKGSEPRNNLDTTTETTRTTVTINSGSSQDNVAHMMRGCFLWARPGPSVISPIICCLLRAILLVCMLLWVEHWEEKGKYCNTVS